MFSGVYKNKKVLVTGNTGFKGSWLSIWLYTLGAEVYGISNEIPTNPSLFEIADLSKIVNHSFEDIRNLEGLKKIIHDIKPDFLFHLAAQPIVKESYSNPLDTMTTNIIGTANILESLRLADFECTAIIITSDKCYDNVEWEWGYKETDALGGKDPYSASKGAAEIMVKTYFDSYFKHENSSIRVNSVRAGNVIGGGDWAASRLVPDMFRSWSKQQTVTIRSPYSTRPWQHVLEPLSGYLRNGEALYKDKSLNGLAFNFGPNSDQNKTVLDLLVEIGKHITKTEQFDLYNVESNTSFHEAGLLKLNCDRALHYLQWKPTLHFDETVEFTARWYDTFYHQSNADMLDLTTKQISDYIRKAEERKNPWTN
ncbi:MAG: CDP-glucose 4,6-dehydratase [Bacteroidia bacterium]